MDRTNRISRGERRENERVARFNASKSQKIHNKSADTVVFSTLFLLFGELL